MSAVIENPSGVTAEGTLKEIRERLAYLQPAVEEHQRLTEAAEAVEAGLAQLSGQAPVAAKAPARKAPSANGSGAAARSAGKPRGRKPGGGKRQKQLIRLVKKQPGLKVADYASQMKVSSTQVHGLVRRLVDQGQLERQDRELHLPSSNGASAG